MITKLFQIIATHSFTLDEMSLVDIFINVTFDFTYFGTNFDVWKKFERSANRG